MRGVNDVALRLRHLGAVFDNHPLSKQASHGLGKAYQPEVAHHLGEEPHVDQVEDGVLDAADVLVHREPVFNRSLVDGRGRDFRVGVAVKVPGRINERVHGVGLAPRRTAALRAARLDKLRRASQWRAALAGELDV